MRGPVVYCFEQTDQEGKDRLCTYRIPEDAEIREEVCTGGILSGMVLLHLDGIHLKQREDLYSEEKPEQEPACLTAIPYYAWANREEGEMRVWMPENSL